jgi:hypothetical protein
MGHLLAGSEDEAGTIANMLYLILQAFFFRPSAMVRRF